MRFRSRRTDRSHTEAKTVPHAGDGFADAYCMVPHQLCFAANQHTQPNPKLQRHLDPAGFLCRALLARSRKWCDNAGQNHLFRLFQHFSRSGFGLALRRCSTTWRSSPLFETTCLSIGARLYASILLDRASQAGANSYSSAAL